MGRRGGVPRPVFCATFEGLHGCWDTRSGGWLISWAGGRLMGLVFGLVVGVMLRLLQGWWGVVLVSRCVGVGGRGCCEVGCEM